MRLKISVEAGAYFSAGLFVLLLGPQWVGAVFFSALVHELGHMLALWVLGRRIYGIRIAPFGARIETENLSGTEGILCALAGPGAGAVLTIFFRWMPKIGMCALVQTLFNLLPVYPLDGGRAFRYWREEKAVAKSIVSGYNKQD